jgi:regulator of nucleoside diphosphate kinase
MANRIYITKPDLHELHRLIDQHVDWRDGVAAHRLAGELDRAVVVDPQQLPADVVTMSSWVAFENMATGARREVIVVYPGDADPGAGRVSVLAPIGAALLGLRVGDTIEWPLPGDRTVGIRILEVKQPPRPEESAA